MSKLVSLNARIQVDAKTFSISLSDDSVNFRDLTDSRTGRHVTEKQAKMIEKVVTAARKAAGKLALPSEPRERASAMRKSLAPRKAKAAPAKGRGRRSKAS